MKINRLAIIPARGGSKRIKNKNVKLFCGKPIISYSIKNAQKSKLFSKIHVSTESYKIRKIASRYGVNFDFMRPRYLSHDNIGLFKVIEFVTKKFQSIGIIYDEVWLIMPCSPLIELNDLKNASKLFRKFNSKKIVLSITDYATPIEWAYSLNPNNKIDPIFPKKIKKSLKNISNKFHDSGSFVIYNSNFFISNRKIHNSDFVGFKISRDKAIDIDDNIDWKIAESIHKFKKNS